MKKIFITVSLFLFGIALYANDVTEKAYVKTAENTYFCNDMKWGLFNVRVCMDNGQSTNISRSQITAYYRNGKLFEKLPLYNGRNDFMEFVHAENGLKLYKYGHYVEGIDKTTGAYHSAQLLYDYYIFKDGKFYLKVDEKNYKTVLNFFGLKVIE